MLSSPARVASEIVDHVRNEQQKFGLGRIQGLLNLSSDIQDPPYFDCSSQMIQTSPASRGAELDLQDLIHLGPDLPLCYAVKSPPKFDVFVDNRYRLPCVKLINTAGRFPRRTSRPTYFGQST
jgi:hypothetical protein